MHTEELFKTSLQLWRHPALTRAQIVAFQERKLRSLFAHAHRRVPYYRELLERAGIGPREIRGLEDLAAIPVSTSQAFRTRPLDQIIAAGVNRDRLVVHNTSGSSGRPFTVRRGYWEEHLLNLFRIRAMRALGVRFSDRSAQVVLTSGIGDSAKLSTTLPRRLRRAMGIFRDHQIDCLQPPEVIVDQLERLAPDIIAGYPAVISMLAPLFASRSSRVRAPRLVLTGAESLFPFKRQLIQRGFGARVFDTYGANECNLLAWECPVTGQYHTCDDSVVVEILRDGRHARPGEAGEVVITCLHSYAMPFIRYSLGDIATRGAEVCPCGQPFSTLTDIRGRLDDYFLLPDGRSIHPYEIDIPAIISREETFVRQYRLVQERVDRVVLEVVPARPASQDELDDIRSAASSALGPEVEFCINLVDELGLEASGKFQYRRSLVRSDYPPPDAG